MSTLAHDFNNFARHFPSMPIRWIAHHYAKRHLKSHQHIPPDMAFMLTYVLWADKKYSDSQPRVPAGSPGGGQWTSGDGGGDHTSLGQTVTHLQQNAKVNGHATGNCAQAVRKALAAGGISITPPPPRQGNNRASAADYGPSLIAAGAKLVASEEGRDVTGLPAGFPPTNYDKKIGDIVIFPAFAGHTDGHMAMWDGSNWISDFKQDTPWPNNSSAKAYGPSYKIYRFQSFHN